MTTDSIGPTLTLDESVRLAGFLARRGHREAAFRVMTPVVNKLLEARLAAEQEIS